LNGSNIETDTNQRNSSIDIDDVLAILNCIELISKPRDFIEWLKKYHNLKGTLHIFEGYKFAIDTLCRMASDQIADQDGLGLEEDAILRRALFAGIPLDQVPNSCDKTVVLKNLHAVVQKLLRSTNWITYKFALSEFETKVLSTFTRIKTAAIFNPTTKVTNIDDMLSYLSIFQTYIFLSDTHSGFPHGYTQSLFERDLIRDRYSDINTRHYSYVFEGYKYAVQFLWYQLLGNEFQHSCVAKLHETKTWMQFDSYFEKIRANIITPIEKQIGYTFAFGKAISFQGNAKEYAGELIKTIPPEPKLSAKEILDQKLLWYNIQLIDATEHTFNGVASFLPLLIGEIHLREKDNCKEPLRIIRLDHPHDDQGRYFISYGILIDVISSHGMADYSGWLLFYNCLSSDVNSGHQSIHAATNSL